MYTYITTARTSCSVAAVLEFQMTDTPHLEIFNLKLTFSPKLIERIEERQLQCLYMPFEQIMKKWSLFSY